MSDDRWSDLQAVWQASDADARGVDARRVKRALRAARWSRTAVAAVALTLLVAAVAHAASPAEAVLALVAGASIGIAWLLDVIVQRRERDLLAQPTTRYLDERIELIRAQLRALRFVWLVAAIALLFLGPWWKEGIPIHFGSFSSLAAISSFWLPIAAIVGFIAWTVARAVSMRRELRALSISQEATK